MAYTGTLCTETDVTDKTGNGVDAAVNTDMIDHFVLEAEALLTSASRYDFVTNYSDLKAETKGLLREATSNLAAVYCIQYDMSGYTSRIEAENMINILMYKFNLCYGIITSQKTIDYMREV